MEETNKKVTQQSTSDRERFYNKEIIKSLSTLRIQSKNYPLRQKYLDSKTKALIKIGGLIKSSRLRASEICVQVLGSLNPGLMQRGKITTEDWEKQPLLYKTVISSPTKRSLKANYKWEEVIVEAKRISDKRGVDNKIEVTHPISKAKVRTP